MLNYAKQICLVTAVSSLESPASPEKADERWWKNLQIMLELCQIVTNYAKNNATCQKGFYYARKHNYAKSGNSATNTTRLVQGSMQTTFKALC